MAEFCKDCFEKLLPNWIVTTTSNDVDLCEGCGEWKQVVIEASPINAGEGFYDKNQVVCKTIVGTSL